VCGFQCETMATINLKHPWEQEEEDFLPPAEEEDQQAEQTLEEEELVDEQPEEIEEPTVEVVEDPEPELKKEQPIVRHIIPIHPDVAEAHWGIPLNDKQRGQLEEDWRQGFRGLTQEEREWYGISDDPETYANMESLSKNYLKVVANQGKEDLIALELGAGEDGWAEGYLRDRNGRFTERCVVELLNMREHTREHVLPREPDGRTDLNRFRRGDLNPKRKIRVINDKYSQRFDYWEALRERARRWRQWKEDRDKAIPVYVEVNGEPSFGELITTPSTQAKVEQEISSALQRIEQVEQLLYDFPDQLKEQIWETIKPKFTKLGLDIREKGFAHTYETAITGQVETENESTQSHQDS